MSSDPPTKPTGLSLYANLLEPSNDENPGTITGAPVVYKQPGNGETSSLGEAGGPKQSISAAALRFQPTRRPNVAAQKPKSTTSKVLYPQQERADSNIGKPFIGNAAEGSSSGALSLQGQSQSKSTIADWTAEGDEDEYYLGSQQRQRGGRKRRKKTKEQAPVAQDWDDIYDPSRPNNYEEYKHSEERIRELREWKDRIYAHRMSRHGSEDSDSVDDRRPAMQFAPPEAYLAPDPPSPEPDKYVPPPPPISEIPNDSTGEDAYARRMRMSQPHGQSTLHSQSHSMFIKPAPASTVSRAPVRYSLPAPPPEIPTTEAELQSTLEAAERDIEEGNTSDDAPRSVRPGQRGFAERLMTKYGWNKGQGLGAKATGIITPLQAKVDKRKQRPDAEGGGFIGPGGMGKIVGGKKKGGEEAGRFGAMSDVVVLRGMVDGLDLQHELTEGNLMQEIGEECGEKYGRVERVFIDQSANGSIPVFIKFTSQLSALRAVNALEGRTFNGNTMVARFFESEKFDSGQYV